MQRRLLFENISLRNVLKTTKKHHIINKIIVFEILNLIFVREPINETSANNTKIYIMLNENIGGANTNINKYITIHAFSKSIFIHEREVFQVYDFPSHPPPSSELL